MDRRGFSGSTGLLLAVLAAAGLSTLGKPAAAQTGSRLVRNPATNRLEPAVEQSRPSVAPAVRQRRLQMPTEAADPVEQYDERVEPAGFYADSCDDACCDLGCGDAVCGVPCDDYASCGVPGDCCDDCLPCSPPRCAGGFFAGFEAVMVQPRYGGNEAFTTMLADGGSFESFTTTDFDYGLEFTPRAYLGWQNSDGVGIRAAWWQFDHEATSLTTSPPSNGFGRISQPAFGDIDISSNIATDVFAAAADLNAYSIDFEFTKSTSFSSWDLGVGCGFRYASVEQSYRGAMENSAGTPLGSIDFRHKLDGYGPTVSLDAYRRIYSDAGIFCKARGSALFGEGMSRLDAVEDANLSTPFVTTRNTSRDDLLPVGELQVGLRWEGLPRRGRVFRPVASVAMEGQVWHGAGNAASEDGSLGFYGFNAGAGLLW